MTDSKIINIEWLSDEYECETCGTTYAEGAHVVLPDGTELHLTPTAHCYACTSYGPEAVYAAIFKALGYTLNHDDE